MTPPANVHRAPRPVLVVTDLDGTLLDHDTYSFDAARPALARLAAAGVALVPASSKTVAELEPLCARLGTGAPRIAENGSVLDIPAGSIDPSTAARRLSLGTRYEDVLAQLATLRADGFRFRGFADMDDAEVAERTGLPVEQARLARARDASEPLLWQDGDSRLNEFTARLDAAGLAAVRGGRFVSVQARIDKADAVRRLTDLFADAHGGARPFVIAAGDAANDLAMLSSADIAVVVASPTGSRLGDPSAPTVLRPDGLGPEGFRRGIDTALDRLGL